MNKKPLKDHYGFPLCTVCGAPATVRGLEVPWTCITCQPEKAIDPVVISQRQLLAGLRELWDLLPGVENKYDDRLAFHLREEITSLRAKLESANNGEWVYKRLAKLEELESKVAALEKDSHPPVNLAPAVEQIVEQSLGKFRLRKVTEDLGR